MALEMGGPYLLASRVIQEKLRRPARDTAGEQCRVSGRVAGAAGATPQHPAIWGQRHSQRNVEVRVVPLVDHLEQKQLDLQQMRGPRESGWASERGVCQAIELPQSVQRAHLWQAIEASARAADDRPRRCRRCLPRAQEQRESQDEQREKGLSAKRHGWPGARASVPSWVRYCDCFGEVPSPTRGCRCERTPGLTANRGSRNRP